MFNCKDLPSQSGVYKITSPSGRTYIGEAINLKARCSYYLNPKRVKKQRALYNSLIKHGVENHKIEVIELCSIELLMERERYWQEFYGSVEGGLNCHYSSTSTKKKLHSSATIKLMSEKSSGVNNGFFGKKHTKESLQKISEANKGSNNASFGQIRGKEYIDKQITSNSKNPLKVTDSLTNEISFYRNSKECAVAFNVNHSNVRTCKGKYKLKRRYIIEAQ